MFNKKIKKIMEIEGMSCIHCAMKVETTLGSLEDVSKVKVSLRKKIAIIYLKKDVDFEILKKPVEELGYQVLSIK